MHSHLREDSGLRPVLQEDLGPIYFPNPHLNLSSKTQPQDLISVKIPHPAWILGQAVRAFSVVQAPHFLPRVVDLGLVV